MQIDLIYFNFYKMVCVCALIPSKFKSGLIISRLQSKNLSKFIEDFINEELFVFNTTSGVYIFSSNENLNSVIVRLVMKFLEDNSFEENHITLSRNTKIFDDRFVKILSDKKISSLGWKNFISSFINQLNPFYGNSNFIHGLFRRFVFLIKENGNSQQLDYFKNRMNILRSRVDLDLALNVNKK